MRRQRGISWLELAVALLVISVLSVFTLGALWRAQGQAEAVAVDLTLRSMATGLRLKQLDLLLRGDVAGTLALAGANPVAWLGGPPANYSGEIDGEPAGRPAWYFDLRRRELAYRPGSGAFPLPEGRTELRWRVELTSGAAAMPGARIRAIGNIRDGVK